MSHFVIIFQRHRGETPAEPVVEEYEDADEAQARLFEVELELQSDPTRGVVLLVGDHRGTLEHTHGSYFLNIDELLEKIEG